MTCAQYRRWFSPYVDGLLDGPSRAQLDAHLQGCAACRGELVSLQQMLRALQAMEPPATPELLTGIHAKLQAEPWWQAVARRFLSPWPASLPLHGLALATTALLVVIIANLPGVARRDKMFSPQSYYATSHDDKALESPLLASGASRRLAMGDEVSNQNLIQQQSGLALGKAEQETIIEEERQKKAVEAVPPTDLTRGLAVVPETSQLFTQLSAARPDDRITQVEKLAPGTMSALTAPAAATSALGPLQVQWRVADFAAAIAQVSEWVAARQGFAVATNDHHLSIKLPASAVVEFLQRFSTNPPPAPPEVAEPIWLTISLELLPLQ